MSRTYRKFNNIPRKYRYKVRSYNRRYKRETYSYFLFEKEKLFSLYSQKDSHPFKEVYDFIIRENHHLFYQRKFGTKAIDFCGPIYNAFNKSYLLERFSLKKIEWMLKIGIVSLKSFKRKLWIEDDFSSKDSREGFCIYKTRGKVRNLREYRGLKADKRELMLGFREKGQKFDFILDYRFVNVWQTREEFEEEQNFGFQDFQHEYERYYGDNGLISKDEEELSYLDYKIRPRTCPYLIWDDKLATGFIKKSCY